MTTAQIQRTTQLLRGVTIYEKSISIKHILNYNTWPKKKVDRIKLKEYI